VALVRVYCGLASADRTAPAVDTDGWLTAAVVDDAGRLLDVCEIGDNPSGYARLCTVLAERSGGPTAVAIAADRDDHRLTMLLTAAGRALAIADDEAVDDYAERFADDESADEMESPPAERRAVGLARALQAGALSAVSLPAPRDLAGLKNVLVAHAALVTGRHSAAVALREVLRELYPAALRAYPDPAEPVPLAVLDALPEPHSLNGTSGRARDSAATDAVVADLAKAGVADQTTIKEAITALRVAIAETPRRGAATNKAANAAIAETIRQAVAAVRACDAACEALVASLTEEAKAPRSRRSASKEQAASTAAPAPRSRAAHRAHDPGHAAPDPKHSETRSGRRAARDGADTTPAPAGRRSRSQPGESRPAAPRPTAPPPAAPSPVAPAPLAPAAARPALTPPLAPAASAAPAGAPAPASAPSSPPAWVTGTGSNRPVSVPPPPPPGITPIVPGQRPSLPPAAAAEPFRPTLTSAAATPGPGADRSREQASPANSSRATRAAEERQSVAAAIESRSQALRAIRRRSADNAEERDTTSRKRWADEAPAPTSRYSATDYTVPVPTPRPEQPEPGSRGNWPLVSRDDDDLATVPGNGAAPFSSEIDASAASLGASPKLDSSTGVTDRLGALAGGRVTPPWQADDLPPEPPALRLVEPPPLADRALREDRTGDGADITGDLGPGSSSVDLRTPASEPPPLRLVGSDGPGDGEWSGSTANGKRSAGRRAAAEQPVADDEGDGDLLIFAQAKSAWFVGHGEEEPDWDSIADFGWQTAAERTTRPAVGAETSAGLPRRVPQANLLPGSPLTADRPLRIVRDAASIAAHTSGYFRGWRRGQEINGYAVGGRPGRESAGGWDFSRDTGSRYDEEYG